jgi:hypothetical protein
MVLKDNGQNSVPRFPWHKAGIVKLYGYAYSVPQSSVVLEVLRAEADAQGAEFAWISSSDMGETIGSTENRIRMRLGRYSELEYVYKK